MLLAAFWRTIWRTTTDHLHPVAKVIWSDNLPQVLKRAKTALLALSLAFPLNSYAADRAPVPPGTGWVHLLSECRHVGSDCSGSWQRDGKQPNYVISHWGRNAGKRGKIFFLDSAKTFPGQPEDGRSFFITTAVNCDTWEKKSVSKFIAAEEWSLIKPDSILDIAALRFCN